MGHVMQLTVFCFLHHVRHFYKDSCLSYTLPVCLEESATGGEVQIIPVNYFDIHSEKLYCPKFM